MVNDMKEKKRKGIGCATILILLPIPGMIIYGLVTDNFDFAHGFVYGCIVSLVFLIFNIISAIKNRTSDRKARKAAESATKNMPAASAPKPVKSVSQEAVHQTAGAVSQTVHINAPDRKGEGRIVLPEAQKKLLSQQLRRISMLMLCLVLIPAFSVQAFATQSVDNPPDSADVAAVEDEDTTEYEQYNSIRFAYWGYWITTEATTFVPEIVDAKEYTDKDGMHVYHRILHYDAQDKDRLIGVYFTVGGYAPGSVGGEGIFQECIQYQGDKEVSRKTASAYADGDHFNIGDTFTVSKDSTGGKIITEIRSSEGDKVILELLIGDQIEGGEADPVPGTVIHTDASDDKGEMPGFVIPAAIAAVVLLGGGAIIRKGKKRKAAKQDQKESEEEKEDEEEEEDVSYEMRVYKEFGDTINVGDDAVVYARMVAVYPDGSEKTDPSLTARINIYPKTYLSLTSKQMSGDYMGAVVSAPMADTIPEEAVIVFDLEGIYKVEMNFKIGDCIFITDPATGAQEFYTEDRKTGEWVSSDGKTILNLSNLAEWILQRQNDRRWIDQQNEKLRTHDTDFDRMLHEGDAVFEAEQRKIEEETAKILYNLKHYGTLDTDEAHIREIIARDQRIHAIEGRRAGRQAAVYDIALWAATVTKYGTDKAFDFFANYGGTSGKVGKAIYVLATDQAGALEDARLNGKSMGTAAGKALTGSLYNIGKDYFEGGAKSIYIVGGRAAEAAAGALIDGKGLSGAANAAGESLTKSSFEVTTELVGETLGDMADEAGFIKADGKNIYNITVGSSDIVQTAFNDLATMAYDSSAEAMDRSIEAYRKRKKGR